MPYELVEPAAGKYELVDQPAKIGVEGLPDAVKAVAGDFHPLTQMGVGAKALWDMAAMKLKQGAGLDLSPEQQNEIRANRALLEESNPALAGALTSGIGAGALAAPVANFAAARIAPALPRILQPAATAAVGGMTLNAATNPSLPGESSESNIQAGGVGGALADTLLRGGSRLVQPIVQSPAVQRLLQNNVVPTPGQAAGGVLNRLEEKVMSWPFVGDIIAASRNRARNELGTAGINLQMPKGSEVTQPGNAGIEQAKTNLSQGYNNLYGNTTIGRDERLVQDLDAAVNKPTIPLSDQYKAAYDRIIKAQVLDRLKPGETFPTGEVKKQIESSLGEEIRKLGPNPTGQHGDLKVALEAARTAVRDLANRGAGVDQGARTTLDRGWANMKDMETAASRSESNAGVPTPLQIIQAAKERSKLEQLGRSAQEVMGNRVPNSGTTDRALMAMLLGGLGAGASKTETYQQTPFLNELGPAFWLALGTSPLAYSRVGSRYMVGDNAIQPALSQVMRQTAPYAGNMGALYSQYR